MVLLACDIRAKEDTTACIFGVNRGVLRIKDVVKGDSQYRSGWEIAVSVISLVLLMSANSVIWGSLSNVGLKIVESILTLVVMGTAATAVLVKLRFRG